MLKEDHEFVIYREILNDPVFAAEIRDAED
jgi:hypothetical protein